MSTASSRAKVNVIHTRVNRAELSCETTNFESLSLGEFLCELDGIVNGSDEWRHTHERIKGNKGLNSSRTSSHEGR
jgi:hypothetical protein